MKKSQYAYYVSGVIFLGFLSFLFINFPVPSRAANAVNIQPDNTVSLSCLPGIDLSQGSRGQVVKTLQTELKRLGFYPEGLITGYYGPLTQKAVDRYEASEDFAVCRTAVPVPVDQVFNGLLSKFEGSTIMWGTHTIQGYPVKAASNSVQYALDSLTGSYVVLRGNLIWNDFEGGFWGVVATEVRGIPSTVTSTQVFSPQAGDVWYTGGTYKISWNKSAFPADQIALYLAVPEPACAFSEPACLMPQIAPFIINEVVQNTGSYEWYIPADLGRPYVGKVKVIVSAPASGVSYESGVFTIKSGLQTIKNQSPVITSLQGPSVLHAREEGTWKISAYDPEEGTLNFSVDWGDVYYKLDAQNGLSLVRPQFNNAQTATFTHSYASAGFYTVSITVSDESGLTAKSTITVNVR